MPKIGLVKEEKKKSIQSLRELNCLISKQLSIIFKLTLLVYILVRQDLWQVQKKLRSVTNVRLSKRLKFA